MSRFFSLILCILATAPIHMAFAQLSSSNYQIDNFTIGQTELTASSTNYQVDHANDGQFIYDEPVEEETGGGTGGSVEETPDPEDPPPDPEPEPDPDTTPPPDSEPPPSDGGVSDDGDGTGSGSGSSDDDESDNNSSGSGSGTSLYTPDKESEDLSSASTETENTKPEPRNWFPNLGALSPAEVFKKVASIEVEEIAEALEPTVTRVNTISENQQVEAATVTGGFVVTLLSLLRTPFSVTGFGRAMTHFGSNLLGLFAYRKRRRPWGTVYDSVTKYPLDPAFVELFDKEGASVASAITDLDGRYGFVVPEGEYQLIAKKSNYTFPSKHKVLTSTDVLYTNLYYGGLFTMTGAVALNIPMDPVGKDWNQYEKLRTHQTRFIHRFDPYIVGLFNVLFYAGVFLAIWQAFLHPAPISFALLALYLVLFAVRLQRGGPVLFGTVKRGSSPLPFAVVRVMSGTAEITSRITDEYGRYVAIVPPGTYQVRVEERTGADSYEMVYQSIVKTKKGIINGVLHAG